MIINPVGMTVENWANQMGHLTGKLAPVAQLDNPTRWREWAYNLLLAIHQPNLPDPAHFEKWEDWAQRLFSTIEF